MAKVLDGESKNSTVVPAKIRALRDITNETPNPSARKIQHPLKTPFAKLQLQGALSGLKTDIKGKNTPAPAKSQPKSSGRSTGMRSNKSGTKKLLSVDQLARSESVIEELALNVPEISFNEDSDVEYAPPQAPRPLPDIRTLYCFVRSTMPLLI
jgi:hypothetical protein